MTKGLRIKRLERLWSDQRPICVHAFTLILDGQMVQDDAPCPCGGERITLIAADEEREAGTQVEPAHEGAHAAAKSA
jgi:hypothetical protein